MRRCCAGMLLSCALVAPAGASSPTSVSGAVESGGSGLGAFDVELFATRGQPHAYAQRLGAATTGSGGQFRIDFEMPSDPKSVLYLVARRGPVALATTLADSPNPMAIAAPRSTARPSRVVINERTTVAVAFALAQFLERGNVAGNVVGVRNGGAMVGDLVEVRTGDIAPVLGLRPNGAQTSTLATFNSLANLVQSCVTERPSCAALLGAAPGSKGRAASDTLQAIVNIARNLWRNVERLYCLSTRGPQDYRPALASSLDAWTIALKFLGDGRLNGLGAFEIDAEGNAWLTNNFTPGWPEGECLPRQAGVQVHTDRADLPGFPL